MSLPPSYLWMAMHAATPIPSHPISPHPTHNITSRHGLVTQGADWFIDTTLFQRAHHALEFSFHLFPDMTGGHWRKIFTTSILVIISAEQPIPRVRQRCRPPSALNIQSDWPCRGSAWCPGRTGASWTAQRAPSCRAGRTPGWGCGAESCTDKS